MTNDVYPGKDLGALDVTISEEMVQHYIHGLGEANPWYASPSPFGGPVAPALIFEAVSSRFQGWYLDNLFGNLWMRQEWTIHAPVRIGQTLHCTARVADRYRKRDRDVVAQEVWLRDDAGQLVARGIHHQSFLAEQTGGEVALRPAQAKEGAQKHADPTGEPLALELKKAFTADMCEQFFHANRNYHNDKEESKKLGFQEVVIGGRMTLACISELLTRHFGRRWYLGGHLDIKFTNVLWLNEPCTTRGVITGHSLHHGQQHTEVAVFCEKADGTKVIVGTARIPEQV